MYKRVIPTILMIALFISNAAFAEESTNPVANVEVKVKQTKEVPKTSQDSSAREDKRYAQIYTKCTKEAEEDLSKYERFFNYCMEKNGFPQEQIGGRITEEQDN